MVTKIWDSTSNNEISVRNMSKGLDRRHVRQNIAYLVFVCMLFECGPILMLFIVQTCDCDSVTQPLCLKLINLCRQNCTLILLYGLRLKGWTMDRHRLSISN